MGIASDGDAGEQREVHRPEGTVARTPALTASKRRACHPDMSKRALASLAVVLLAACVAPKPPPADAPTSPIDAVVPIDTARVAVDAAADAASDTAADTSTDVSSDTAKEVFIDAPVVVVMDAPRPVDGTLATDVTVPRDVPDAGALDPSLARWFAQLAAYRTGGSVDHDGDGHIDTVVRVDPDGTRTLTIMRPVGTGENGRIVIHPDGTHTATDDSDGNGRAEHTLEQTLVGTTLTDVERWDDDQDGVWDRRVTQTITGVGSDDPHFTAVTENSTPQGAGEPLWSEVFRGSGGSHQNQTCDQLGAAAVRAAGLALSADGGTDAGADAARDVGARADAAVACTPAACTSGSDGVDAQMHAGAGPVTNSAASSIPNVRIVDVGPTACDAAQTSRLDTQLLRVLADMRTRIRVFNPFAWEIMSDALANRVLVIGCGNCAAGATTQWQRIVSAGANVINMTVAPLSLCRHADELEEILTHEMFHFAGFNHTDNGGGEEGKDFIYACGRFNVHCRSYDPPTTWYQTARIMDSSRDCARCNDRAHRRTCGPLIQVQRPLQRNIVELAPGSPLSTDICTNDSGGRATCLCGLETQWVYCDRTPPLNSDRAIFQLNRISTCLSCPPAFPNTVTPAATNYVGIDDADHPRVRCSAQPGCSY
jgi:hypothetical protein